MGKQAPVRGFLKELGKISATLPEKRPGHPNQQYEVADVVFGAFTVFFAQSASFLAHQQEMQETTHVWGKLRKSVMFTFSDRICVFLAPAEAGAAVKGSSTAALDSRDEPKLG